MEEETKLAPSSTLYLCSMPVERAQETAATRCCSNCYGHLVVYLTDDGAIVKCHHCGDDTRGYVRKAWADRMRQQSAADLLDAKQVLKNIIPDLSPKKSETELLRDLGF